MAKMKAKDKVANIINILLEKGFELDGTSQGEAYKLITKNSYPLPGALVEPAIRQRLKKSGTEYKVTVGKVTTNFYRAGKYIDKMQFMGKIHWHIKYGAFEFTNFKTKDEEGIKNFVETVIQGQIIKVNCEGEIKVFLDEITPIAAFVRKDNLDLLKISIKNSGFFTPFILWDKFIIDGSQRRQALFELQKDGWKLPGCFPANVLKLENRQDAIEKFLELNKNEGEFCI